MACPCEQNLAPSKCSSRATSIKKSTNSLHTTEAEGHMQKDIPILKSLRIFDDFPAFCFSASSTRAKSSLFLGTLTARANPRMIFGRAAEQLSSWTNPENGCPWLHLTPLSNTTNMATTKAPAHVVQTLVQPALMRHSRLILVNCCQCHRDALLHWQAASSPCPSKLPPVRGFIEIPVRPYVLWVLRLLQRRWLLLFRLLRLLDISWKYFTVSEYCQ